MPRPRKYRMVSAQPVATFYKPQGVPLHKLQGVVLPVEGLEALRLADAQGLNQTEAAEQMGISRATFCRVLAEARSVVARALSQGWAIRIEGGDYRLTGQPEEPGRKPGMGRGRGRGHGGGHGGGNSQGG
ncbi:MAG: DUF134 domain-containing protein [Proteobacteria bacterium]|nr:DUF134 domain-containing protein [Pseudomonadota bacterium]